MVVNIDNIKETNFSKDTSNLPLTSDDNVLNKLDGFFDDTRLLGIEMALKGLSQNKIGWKDTVLASGSVASVANSEVQIASISLNAVLAKRWLLCAFFDCTSNANSVVSGIVKFGGNQVARIIRYNASSGGGASWVYPVAINSGTNTFDFSSYAFANVGNLRVMVAAIPLGGSAN